MVVYFIQRQSDNAIKIGYSNNIKCRYSTIKSRIKTDLEILCLIPGEREIEQSIHKKFNDIRIEGEWFLPDIKLFKYIQSLQDESLDIDDVWNDIYSNTVVIPIKIETREALRKLSTIKGDTYNSIINRLLNTNNTYQQLKDYCQQLESIVDPEILNEIHSGD